MKIDLTSHPDPDIFDDRKRYILWFCLAMACVGIAIGVGVFAVLGNSGNSDRIGDWALGILVASAVAVTWSGNKLQGYKKLFPPQAEKLHQLRRMHPAIEQYCSEVEVLGRRTIRAEYEACLEYSENNSEMA